MLVFEVSGGMLSDSPQTAVMAQSISITETPRA